MIERYFWNGREVIQAGNIVHAFRGERYVIAPEFHNLPCLEFYTHGSKSPRIGRYSYLGWKRVIKAKVPKALLAFALINGVQL